MPGTRTSRPHPSGYTLLPISKRTEFSRFALIADGTFAFPAMKLTDFLGKAGGQDIRAPLFYCVSGTNWAPSITGAVLPDLKNPTADSA